MHAEKFSKENAINETSKIDALSEKNSAFFPVHHSGEVIYGDNTPMLEENVILHYFQSIPGGEHLHRFKLLKIISGLHYIFSFGQSFGSSYNFSFKTEEYEYATTKLTKDGHDEIGKTLSEFLDSIAKEGIEIEKIDISPADAAYSSQEIEECIDAILVSPGNTLTREEISTEHKGHEIFELYRTLYGSNFQTRHFGKRSRAHGRARFFRNIVRNYLPDWEIDDHYMGSAYLKRKK